MAPKPQASPETAVSDSEELEDMEADDASAEGGSEYSEAEDTSSGYDTPSSLLGAMLVPDQNMFLAEPSEEVPVATVPKHETILERRSKKHAGTVGRASPGKGKESESKSLPKAKETPEKIREEEVSNSEGSPYSSEDDLDALPEEGYEVRDFPGPAPPTRSSGLGKAAFTRFERSPPPPYVSDEDEYYGRGSRHIQHPHISLGERFPRHLVPLSLVYAVGFYLFPWTHSLLFPVIGGKHWAVNLGILSGACLGLSAISILGYHRISPLFEDGRDPTLAFVALFSLAALFGVASRAVPYAFWLFEAFLDSSDPNVPQGASPTMRPLSESYPSSSRVPVKDYSGISWTRAVLYAVMVPAGLAAAALGLLVLAAVAGVAFSWDVGARVRDGIVGTTGERSSVSRGSRRQGRQSRVY